LRTTDGGSIWTTQTCGTSYPLSGVHFTNADTGWAVGWFGTILHTTDGGSTWTLQASGTANSFRGVHFTDSNTGWVVGAGGTILHTTTGGVTSIEENGNFDDSPVILSLVHNFPNPFNRQTTIEYTLPEKNTVSVNIYNVLGREIRSLLHKFQQAGTHSVVWNSRDNAGRKVSSGTYFLRLEAGEQTSTKKLCVVR
jgi:hypothetical protein